MRRAGLAAALVLPLGLGPTAGLAQEAPAAGTAPAPALPRGVPILTVDQERLFAESAFGKASQTRIEAALAALADENRRIDAALEAEERGLTDQRATLAPEAFALLAEAFDAKVNDIRAAQDAKSREISRQRDADRQRFYERALPILGAMMAETGAVAVLDKATIVLSLSAIDMTEAAIARINAALADPP
jgi:Skp family chaperone for outer membrane proteins